VYREEELAKDNNGLLFGMTSKGGTNDDGVIFSFDLNRD